MKKYFFVLIFLAFSFTTFAQIGGKEIFSFVNMPTNAKIVGLGGINISADAKDANAFTQNPSLQSAENQGVLSLNYINYYANINQTSLAYGVQKNKFFLSALGFQYVGYGDFSGFDASGNPTSGFSAKDMALTASFSHQIKPFSMGLNAKLVSSSIDTYSSMGVLFDLGGTFIHPTNDFKIGLVIKNFGFNFSNYSPNGYNDKPFDVQIGFSFKPEKMPIRFSVTAHHLHQLGKEYETYTTKILDAKGKESLKKLSNLEKGIRHFVIGIEFLFNPNFQLRAGYNFMQSGELSIEQDSRIRGFSFGAMLKVKNFEIAVSRSLMHISGGFTSLTLSMNTKSFFKKKVIVE
ncbi:MAG: hypothetical protein EAZ97_09490 [Bacteroidetes bacterium]|nr:MAG: hypothetical protein EAZ97_09490 [Bacteroidota bacterium]